MWGGEEGVHITTCVAQQAVQSGATFVAEQALQHYLCTVESQTGSSRLLDSQLSAERPQPGRERGGRVRGGGGGGGGVGRGRVPLLCCAHSGTPISSQIGSISGTGM